VLEWCKLFADTTGKHYWANVVTNKVGFKAGLLKYLGIDEAIFEKEIAIMLRYRDKFLAHLDSDEVMNIPGLDTAKKAAFYYYAYLVTNETREGDFLGFDPELDAPYEKMEKEAEAAYRRVR
jgi:hypothetical protein